MLLLHSHSPIPQSPFAILFWHFHFHFHFFLLFVLLRGKCSRKTLNCRHLLAENNSCAFMCIESIRKCQCINILLCSLSFSPYNVYDNMVSYGNSTFCSLLLFGIRFFSLSVSGEVKYANYAQVRLVPQLFASSSSLSLWQRTLGCLPQLVVAMNFATKNAQAAQREGEEERETHSILVTLCQRFYSWKPTRSSSFKAVKHVFAERNRNEVSFLWSCLLVVRVACHIVEPNIMAILRAGLKETQAEQSRAEESVSS